MGLKATWGSSNRAFASIYLSIKLPYTSSDCANLETEKLYKLSTGPTIKK